MIDLQGSLQRLKHWDSALEDSHHSPRITSKVSCLPFVPEAGVEGRGDPSETPPNPAGAMPAKPPLAGGVASDSHTLEHDGLSLPPILGLKGGADPSGTPLPSSPVVASDSPLLGQQETLSTLPTISESDAVGKDNPLRISFLPPDGVASDLHLHGQQEPPLLITSELSAEGKAEVQLAYPSSTRLNHADSNAAGHAALLRVQSAPPAAQQPADSNSDSGAIAAAMSLASGHVPGHSSPPLASISQMGAFSGKPLGPRRPTGDGSITPGSSNAVDLTSNSTLGPSLTHAEINKMHLHGEAALVTSGSTVSQTDNGSHRSDAALSSFRHEPAFSEAASASAAGVSDKQAAAAQRYISAAENIGAGLAEGIPSRATPTNGLPSPGTGATAPMSSILSTSAAVSTGQAQGIPTPAATGAPPSEGILSSTGTKGQAVYPSFGVAGHQNLRSHMEDREDVQLLDLPAGPAHMLAVRLAYSLTRCVQATDSTCM